MTKLEEILGALGREGLKASLLREDPVQIELQVSPTCTGDTLSRAYYQANRALRVCSVLTGQIWGARILGVTSPDQGSVTLLLEPFDPPR